MTLGELKRDLRRHSIRVEVTIKDRPVDGMEAGKYVTVFVNGAGNVYNLVTTTGLDDEEVSPEKIKALKRSLIENWKDEDGEESES